LARANRPVSSRPGCLAPPPSPRELTVATGLPPPITFTDLPYPDASQVTFTLALCAPGDYFSATFQCPGADGLDLPDLVLDVTRPEVQAFVDARYGDGGGSTLDGGINCGEPGGGPVAVGYLLGREDRGPG